MTQQLLILGCGYVGKKLAQQCIAKGMHVSGTTRHQEHAQDLEKLDIQPIVINSPIDIANDILAQTTHIIDSIPLTRSNADMFASQTQWLRILAPKLQRLVWAGYLSTTGVYGDANGDWVDEDYICKPSSARGKERLKAEQAWLQSTLPAEVFRLAGIYGPERNIIAKLMQGNYKVVKWQPDHFSSRIHVDDIVAALLAAMQSPRAGRVINVSDDLPLPHSEYMQQVAAIVGAPKPIILTPDEGQKQLSTTALSFFSDNKRICNQLLHDELLPQLYYPSFKEGIHNIINHKDN